jgi:uncharacterized protein YbbC (DUF1343 family)
LIGQENEATLYIKSIFMVLSGLNKNRFLLLLMLSFCLARSLQSQDHPANNLRLVEEKEISTGAERTESYLPLLEGKNVGIVCNNTSVIGQVPLADSLISRGIHVAALFSPEHGFKGDRSAGEEINDTSQLVSAVRIISLYGTKKKPSVEDLKGIDIMVFDIQDVGVRFYTYISSLSYVMEACAENGIPLIVLDRPNPNGFYIDGPVLDTCCHSFVGLHPVPIVYGLTIGEYAMMVNGEGWLKDSVRCELTVIPLKGWDRNMIVKLPVRPSPNLPNWKAVYMYPFLCLFEGTVISVGRGTEYPFQVIGHPKMVWGSFGFTPRNIPGVAEKPPFQDQNCYGTNLTGYAESFLNITDPFTLWYLLNAYNNMFLGDAFFNNYFEKLAGNRELRMQIENGLSEEVIRKSWEPGLEVYKNIRAKYLLYPDIQ